MKINILYNFKTGPYGGGNQFLKALRREFVEREMNADDPERADVILVNSHHYLGNAIRYRCSEKVFIHRVDGPVFDVRGKDKTTDKIIFGFNELFSDGTIFQSNWSREKCYMRGLPGSRYETVIINAPDSDTFNTKGKGEFRTDRRIRLISNSWSSNWRKGFEIYKFLDENLDFSRYEMTFVGNSPVAFTNVKYIRPVPSHRLADLLRNSDIFVIGSENDPCSNSLIEALHCGLPAVARNSGGHREIIGKAGELFENSGDVILSIEKVVADYAKYQSLIASPDIREVAGKYLQFMKMVFDEKQNMKYKPKNVTLQKRIQFSRLQLKSRLYGLKSRLRSVCLGNE